MPGQFWVATIGGPPVGAAGTAYASSTTLTDVAPSPKIVVPANFLDHIGASLRMTATGVFSTTGTPTLLLGFYYDGVTTALCATGATTTASGVTNLHWRLEATGIVRSIGTSGSIIMSGVCWLATTAALLTSIPMPAAVQAAVTIDTTASKVYTVGATWGTSSASNTLTCHQLIVESVA